ncbi:hypothetical protein LTR04_005506 [Oleoguttula sp. CCFEE 6159]|nr:hypothetical protein LTR04_005506 [Oleoguttula sp. CCFEE 6159]
MDPTTYTSTEALSAPDLPPPPDPSADAGAVPSGLSTPQDIPDLLNGDVWDIDQLHPATALRMLIRSVQALANVSGDIPPTPPVTRPTTPKDIEADKENRTGNHATPITPSSGLSSPCQNMLIGSPEAHHSEPIPDIGTGAEDVDIQRLAIARKFFLKRPPSQTLEEYLSRLGKFCAGSTAVYLAAGVYIHRLCVEEGVVPATGRTIHRLTLASIRIAMKSLEDNQWRHERYAGVGGVSPKQLSALEMSLCFLLDFDLHVTKEILCQRTFALQQAAQQASVVRRRLPSTFQPKLPAQNRTNA